MKEIIVDITLQQREAKPLLRPDSSYYISKMQHICWQLLVPSGHNTVEQKKKQVLYGVEMIFFFFFTVFIFHLLCFSQSDCASVKTLFIVRTAWANVYTDARTLSCFLFYGLRRSSGTHRHLPAASPSGFWARFWNRTRGIHCRHCVSVKPLVSADGIEAIALHGLFFSTTNQGGGGRKSNYFCELCCVVLVSAALYPHEFKQKLKPSQDETLSSANTEGSSAFGILLTGLSQQLKLYLRYLLTWSRFWLIG